MLRCRTLPLLSRGNATSIERDKIHIAVGLYDMYQENDGHALRLCDHDISFDLSMTIWMLACIELPNKSRKSALQSWRKQETYYKRINQEIAEERVHETLSSFLSNVSRRFQDSFPAIMIGNIITRVRCCQATDLHIALGVMHKSLRDHNCTSTINICCS